MREKKVKLAVGKWYLLSLFVSVIVFIASTLFVSPVQAAETWSQYGKLAPTSGSSLGGFSSPNGVAVDSNGNIYVADAGNSRIQKYTAATGVWSQFGRNGTSLGQFKYPTGVAVDSNGNLYVADRDNHRIQKLTVSTGQWSQWGKSGGVSGSALGEFNSPSGVAIDSSGAMYVSDRENHRIQKLTGSTWSQWGKSGGVNGSGLGEFYKPMGVAVDSSKNVYVADNSNNRIQKLTVSTGLWSQWGKSGGVSGTGLGEFSDPTGVAVDNSGNVYVADRMNHRVQKLTGTTWSQWGKSGGGNGNELGEFFLPTGLTVDSSGNVYVADSFNGRIQKLTVLTATWNAWGLTVPASGSGLGQFNNPSGVGIDSSGNMYVADKVNNRIQKLAGSTWSQWGKSGGAAGNGLGEFNAPNGVDSDASGNMYVADSGNHRIQKFTGTTWSQWGKSGGVSGTGLGEFNNPTAVAVDSSGNVYVADKGNHRIQKRTGSTWSEWKKSGGGNGTGLGEFNNPSGVAVDSNGNVYVADSGNSRIQKFTASTGTWSEWGKSGGLSGTGLGEFNNPSGVTVDGNGDLYVADTNNHRIQKLTGSTWSEWKKTGGGVGNSLGEFNTPNGVALNNSGNLYVADSGNHRIQKLTITIVPAVTSVVVDPSSASLVQGGSQQLTATVSAVGGAAQTVTWTSSDVSGKVAVDNTGNVTVTANAAPGAYTITATSTFDGSKKGTAAITVTAAPAVTSVVVAPSSASLVQGGSRQLSATVNAVGGAAQTVTWTSSDVSGKVAVDNTGNVTVTANAAPGAYTITATSTFDGSKKGTAAITVTAAPAVTSVVVAPSSASLVQGGSRQLAATVSAVGGAAQTVTWTSSDVSGKVAVDNTGNVTVAANAAPGAYTIMATSTFDGSKQGTSAITVTELPTVPAVTSVVVDPSSASLVQGGSRQLSATVSVVGGAAQTVTWTSSDVSGKVAVDSAGNVTVAADAALGAYTITATSIFDGSKQGTAAITVTELPATPAVTSVVVAPSSASLVQGGSQQLTATVSVVGGATQTVTWTSSDVSGKVAVDSTGNVTVAADAALGAYTITATSTFDGSKKGTAAITVTELPAVPAVTSVVVAPSSASLVQGGSQQLTATVSVVGGAAQTVTWTSSDVSGKVVVDSTGNVTVASNAALGAYTITATSTFDGSKKGTAAITVTELPAAPAVTSVVVDPSSASLVQGGSQQLTATVSVVGGAAQTVTWTSSDVSGKVAVDSTGNVTVAADAALGAYTITATSTFDGSKKGTAVITVTKLPATPVVTSVVVDPSSARLVQGGSQQLTATVSVVGGAAQTVTWTSSDVSGKVAVDSTGNVTVAADAAPGAYTITATSTFDGSKKGSAAITVTELPAAPAVTSVVVDPSSASLVQGGSQQLTATVSAVGGATQTVTWTSSDVSGKVAVDSTGNVTVAADAALGAYTITATSTFDGSKKGTSAITVTELPAAPSTPVIVPAPAPAPVKEHLTVNVEDSGDKSGKIVASAIIERTTGLDGTKKDDIHFTKEQAKKTVDSIVAAGSSSATIVIPDAKDEVSEVKIIIAKDANKLVAEAKIDLRIATENAKVILPFQSLAGFTDDLFFNFVPIKNQNQKQEVNERARQDALVKGVAGDKKVEVIGRPMTIETNMQSRSVTLVMPLKDVHLNESDLKALRIYIEHSDGTKELLTGELVPYNDKGEMGVQFVVNKFSTFTLLHIEGAEGIKQHSSYLKGYADSTFKPENKMTRAEMAAILSRVITGDVNGAAAIAYRDVSSPYWAQDAIAKVTAMGLMKGYTDGTFKPENTITRAEMATIIARLLDNTTQAGAGFTDISGNWAEASILKAQAAGMISGYKDGTFKPDHAMTRAEAVTIINRVLGRVPFSGFVQSRFKDVADTYWALRDIEEASADHEYERTADGGEKWIQKP